MLSILLSIIKNEYGSPTFLQTKHRYNDYIIAYWFYFYASLKFQSLWELERVWLEHWNRFFFRRLLLIAIVGRYKESPFSSNSFYIAENAISYITFSNNNQQQQSNTKMPIWYSVHIHFMSSRFIHGVHYKNNLLQIASFSMLRK